MTRDVSRRTMLRAGAVTAVGIAFAGSVSAIVGSKARKASAAGYGALSEDPRHMLALPPKFSYTVVAESGVTRLDSGEPTPSDPDGTACFPRPGGGYVLVNNHEIGEQEPHRVPRVPGLVFDPGASAGTTTIEVDESGARVREFVSLAGTHNNCAGGVTPWDTWLTCEETEQRADAQFEHDHGWVFEVDPFDQAANRAPVPLKFLGRFSHEAVAVNPGTGAIMLTEDAKSPHGLYYRWTPPEGYRGDKGVLRALASSAGGDTAGTLQTMCAYDQGNQVRDLSLATEAGTTYQVRWVDVPDRHAKDISVRNQFTEGQVTSSHKLEGAWWGDGGAYFVASFARGAADGSLKDHDGQVWFYDPRRETVELKTIFAAGSTGDGQLGVPDNITICPYGGVILAQDVDQGSCHLIGIDQKGEPYALARNLMSYGEFAGPTYSRDGRFLFAGVQDPGVVFAITGPWDRR